MTFTIVFQSVGWCSGVRPSDCTYSAKIIGRPSAVDNYEIEVIADIILVYVHLKIDGVWGGSYKGVYQNPPGTYHWCYSLPPTNGSDVKFEFWAKNVNDGLANKDVNQFSWVKNTLPVGSLLPLPVPVVGTQYHETISPPKIVEEDKPSKWTVTNPKGVMLKPGSFIHYGWKFPDPFGVPIPKTGKILVDDKLTPQLVKDRLRAAHTYKESGIYDILLNLKFIEVVSSGSNTKDVPRDYNLKKLIIVVEHIPEYLGNVLGVISAPPIVKEDVDTPFDSSTMFSFTRILPQGSVSLVDRFEGVEPGTVTYSIDWGDGEVTPDVPYPGTSKADIGTNPNPQVIYAKISDINHKYLIPGDYKVKLIIKYFERKYKDYPIPDANGSIIGYNSRVKGPYTHIAVKKFTVWDQTPPVISNGKFDNLDATSGDPLQIQIDATDNHPVEPIKFAKLHYIFYPANWKKDDSPDEWKTVNANLSPNGAGSWNINASVIIPKDFATKEFPTVKRKSLQKLKYYFQIEDGSGNINYGDVDIVDNHDFTKRYGANMTDYGEINVTDNDPPDILVVLDSKQDNKIYTYEVSGGEADFSLIPGKFGKVKKLFKSVQKKSDELIKLQESPLTVKSQDRINPVEFSNDQNLREDTRIFLSWKVFDTVDGELQLQSDTGLLNKNYIVFSKSGKRKIDFFSFDNVNPDGSVNGRKLLIDLLIQKLSMHRKTLK